MYRLLEWAFAYDDGSGLPDAGAYAAELKNVTATADGKPVQGFDPTKTGTWTIPAGTQVNIVDMPDDWKLDGKAEQPAGTVVFTASKYGTPVVTWTFKNDSATDPDKPADPGTDALKNVAATADGKPIAGFDPTRDGAYKVAAGAKVRISDVPSDWKLDKTESGSKLVFTASKGGTAVTWTFEYQANGGSSATDPGNGGGSNAGGDGQGDPGKTPDTSKPAASPKPAGTADDGQAAGAAPLASTGAGTGPAIAVAGLLAMAYRLPGTKPNQYSNRCSIKVGTYAPHQPTRRLRPTRSAPRPRPTFGRHHGTISCTNRRCMMTQAVAYSNFRANLKTYMRRVNEDADTLLVTNADPEDNVVVMSADDYDSLMETLRVYQNPYLSDKVMRGMAQVRQGQTMAHDLVEAGA